MNFTIFIAIILALYFVIKVLINRLIVLLNNTNKKPMNAYDQSIYDLMSYIENNNKK